MTALHTVEVEHNFETGHRLPHLGGKCQNLHGHSWRVRVEVAGPLQEDGTVLEFGAFKLRLREWIDWHLDHGLMLGKDDPLAGLLAPYGKVFVFGRDDPAQDLAFPTVENVATLLARVTDHLVLPQVAQPDVFAICVRVQETAVNAATWNHPDPMAQAGAR